MSPFRLSALLASLASAAFADEPPVVRASDLLDGKHDYQRVSIIGTVQDVLRDETDPAYAFLAVAADGETVYAALKPGEDNGIEKSRYIGARVRLNGMVLITRTNRKLMGHELSVTNDADIAFLAPAPVDPFDIPELPHDFRGGPAKLATLGRRKAFGQVLAVWNGNQVLLRNPDGDVFSADIADGTMPNCGAFVAVAGIPVTDIHRINLARTCWKPAPPWEVAVETPTNVTASALLYNTTGHRTIQHAFHGRLIRLTGVLRGLPRPGTTEERLYLDCDNIPVTVHTFGISDRLGNIDIGSRIEVTGICLMTLANWQPNMAFPSHDGFSVSLRSPADLRVLSRPPWWTAGRLRAVIIALSGVLVGILLWNRSLRRIAERRGRELLREQIAGVRSELKVEERTRLATELHDSLSQTLTGVALELNIADALKGDAPEAMLAHLTRAGDALKSCRNELRNCLWDLRGQALDEPDMTKAILRALQPYVVGDPRLDVRFNVPRKVLSDNTAHTILCIVRELVLNAFNHGKATSVLVAGCRDGDLICFSVRDNGCGFDTDNHMDATQGHFGLQGIRDRIARAHGTIQIKSEPGAGTSVRIALSISGEGET